MQRVQKIIAAAGLCSRRTAEEWMLDGRVTVNGLPARPGAQADPETDRIEVDGRPLAPEPEKVYLMLNKPRGYVTTMDDERGRRTAAELVQGCGARVYPVGRLDMDSEGLLLFTNDGAMTQRLLHPRFQVDKRYRVTVRGDAARGAGLLRQMDTLDGEPISRAGVEVIREKDGRAVLEMTIHQGKNRQIRRMCAGAGLQVLRLKRVEEHGVALGSLAPGAWRYLTNEEIGKLKGAENT